MFISKKELQELKKIKRALWSCEDINKLNLWEIHKTLNNTTKKVEKRRENAKCFFVGAFVILFFATMLFYALNGYSFTM
jgi:hypothetical protein